MKKFNVYQIDRTKMKYYEDFLVQHNILLEEQDGIRLSDKFTEQFLNYISDIPHNRIDKRIELTYNNIFIATKLALQDRKSTRLNSSHVSESRMPSSA